MYIYVYTHIPIYLCIHDLNEIQDLRMVHFRGKIQAFISLLKKQGLSQTMAWLQDKRSNQKQYLLLPNMDRLGMNREKASMNPAGMTRNYSVFIVPQFQMKILCPQYLLMAIFTKEWFPRTSIWPSNRTSGHTHQGYQIWKRHVHPNVHHSTVCHSQDMEAT